jgi:hypothetical protein
MKDLYVMMRVRGRGKFPMDMLRYDCAYPSDTTSAMRVLTPEDDERNKQRTVYLTSRQMPTVARWASFGWHCETVHVMDGGRTVLDVRCYSEDD